MIPSITLRLQTLVRAMRDVVLPAIPPGAPRAIEQANIVLRSLAIIEEQEKYRVDEILAELREEVGLLHSLLKIISTAKVNIQDETLETNLLEEGKRIAALDIPSQSALLSMTSDLRSMSDQLVKTLCETAPEEAQREMRDIILSHGKKQALRWRIGNVKAGFENNTENLPKLADVLG